MPVASCAGNVGRLGVRIGFKLPIGPWCLRYLNVILALLSVACGGRIYASAAITWSVVQTELCNRIFPSAAIALAATKSPYNPFVVKIKNVAAGAHVKVVVTCAPIMLASSDSFTAKRNNVRHLVTVNALWRFSKLARMAQEIPAKVIFTLYVNGRRFGQREVAVTVSSINACPYAFVDRKRHIFASLSPLFAAYVNGNDPELDGILKQALKRGYVRQFDGYQSSPAGVIKQVAAIWLVLEQRGIHYSNIAKPMVASGRMYYQRVRTVDQSLRAAQANCVDGTVLFASALEHIGIGCDLLHPQGHMFLRFFAGKGDKYPIYLETTLLGAHASINPHVVNPVGRVFPWYDFRDRPFEAATQMGFYEALKDAKAAAKVKGLRQRKLFFSIISIAKARKYGIMPLPAFSGRDSGN